MRICVQGLGGRLDMIWCLRVLQEEDGYAIRVILLCFPQSLLELLLVLLILVLHQIYLFELLNIMKIRNLLSHCCFQDVADFIEIGVDCYCGMGVQLWEILDVIDAHDAHSAVIDLLWV